MDVREMNHIWCAIDSEALELIPSTSDATLKYCVLRTLRNYSLLLDQPHSLIVMS